MNKKPMGGFRLILVVSMPKTLANLHGPDLFSVKQRLITIN